ncbi:MAG: isocitrate lyase, partial [Microvirga sp.]
MTAQKSPASLDDLIPAAPEGRFDGIRRPYSAEDVQRLRGSFPISHTLAERGAQKLWQ